MSLSIVLAEIQEVSLPSQGSFEEIVVGWIILLLVATGVALLSRWFRIPYVTGLVLAGLVIAPWIPDRVSLDSSLILNLFLPILLFEAAINTDVSRLRSTVKPISLLAGPGVVIATAVTAIGIKYALNLPWITALILGVILAITDTVSVIAVFKEVSVPSRLTTIVEGESLFNDGVALVLFNLVLQANLNGSVTIADGFEALIVVIVGGTLVGLALGYLGAGLFARSDDNLSSILLTVALALGTFQVGHTLGVSGVVAVVVAGLMVGNVGQSRQVAASNRVTLYSFWEYAGFGVNTFIFLLIGVEVNLISLWQTLPAVLLAILTYQIGRILAVYPLLTLVGWIDRPIPPRWKHVLFLGNIKGSLSLALALSLPELLPGRSDVITIVFGAVLLSLVGQALSLPWFVKRLRLSAVSPTQQHTEELRAQLIIAKAAQDELDSLLKSGVLPKAIYEEMRSSYQVQIVKAERALRDLYNQWAIDVATGKGQSSRLNGIHRRLLLVEKGALAEAVRRGILTDDTAKDQLRQIDEKLLKLGED